MTEPLITSITRAAELDREATDRLAQIMKAAPIRRSRKAPTEPPTWITKSPPKKAATNKATPHAAATPRKPDPRRDQRIAREKAERNKL